jgi:hypothetical protein
MGEDDPENVWDSPESSSVDVTVYNVAPVTEEKETLTEVESITVATMSVGAARGVMVSEEDGDDVKFALVLYAITVMV